MLKKKEYGISFEFFQSIIIGNKNWKEVCVDAYIRNG